ncbi:MAG: tetratricopeptide repeat protein [Saprospiraceae bacterium]|nr:tetratricopeptide repeat protein [Saprospiraceae bacterium]
MGKRIWFPALLLFLSLLPAARAQSPVDSLLREYDRAADDSLKWLNLFHISQHYAKTNADSALAWARRGLEFAEKNAPFLTPRSLNNVGLQYMNHGNFDQALEFYLRAIEAAKRYNCQPCIATTTGNMGIIAWNKKEYEKAKKYYLEAINLTKTLRDTLGQARYLNNMGLVQTDEGRLDDAAKSFQIVLDLLAAADTIFLQPTVYNNLGNVAYARGNFTGALEYYRQSYEFAQKMGDEVAMFLGLNNTGWAFLAQKKYDGAIMQFSLAAGLAEKIKNERYQEQAVGALADAYKAKGDFKNAFSALEKYLQVHDTIAARLNNKAVMELEARYLTQQKEAELARQELVLQQQTGQKRLILGISLLVVLALAGLFQFVRNRQRIKQREAEHALALEHAETESLRELDRTKSRFFANISHEFRTPLTLILGPVHQWLETAKTTGHDTTPVPVRNLDLVRRNAGRLLDLINQLLDLSKLESGFMRLTVAPGDALQTLRILANAFESMAEQSGIRYEIAIPQTPENVWFDRDKLEKIAANLLSNAFKHTPTSGSVAVRAELRHERLFLEVTDTGAGIPQEALEKVFDRFYQAGGGAGTGIGLALVRELCALHHGSVSVESAPGTGSMFRVEIPVGRAAFSAEERSEAAVAATPSSDEFSSSDESNRRKTSSVNMYSSDEEKSSDDARPLCLVVEDNLELRGYIREQLDGAFRVLLASDGREGLQTALRYIPDLVISDVMMPGMDGNQLCAALKSDEHTSHIPVVLLTARAGQESKIEGLETGADDYLTKPFDSRELLTRAQNLVRQREALRKQFSRTVVLKPQEIALTSTDERFLQRIQQSLDDNLGNDQFSVEELASAVGMSRSQLHRKLTALIDQPPVEFIRNFRLRRAKEMLEAGAGNVSEIGYAVGFSSPAYFSKAFRDAFGVAPSELRG